MAINTLFNTREFFEKTTHFASISRAEFAIRSAPQCLDENREELQKRLTGQERQMLVLGKKLLAKGIVAKSTTIPHQSLITESPFSYGGPTRKHPTVQQFNDIDVEFLLMGATALEARSLYFTLVEWQKTIAGPRNLLSGDIPRSDSTAFAVEFYDNYVTDAEINIYSPTVDKDRPVPIITNLYSELYPITIGSIFTSWDSTDIPASLNVQFCYYYSTNIIGKYNPKT